MTTDTAHDFNRSAAAEHHGPNYELFAVRVCVVAALVFWVAYMVVVEGSMLGLLPG